MNSENIFTSLREAFSGVSLENERTLLDYDYSDVGSIFPEKTLPESKGDRIRNIPKEWSQISRDMLKHTILSGERIKEPFLRWEDIPIIYLYDHCQAASAITPKAFRYYIPAFILNYYNKKNINSETAFERECWIRTLSPDGGQEFISNARSFNRNISELNEKQRNICKLFIADVMSNELERLEIKKIADVAYHKAWLDI